MNHLGVNLSKQNYRICLPKTTKCWWNKFKKAYIKGETYHIQAFEDNIVKISIVP